MIIIICIELVSLIWVFQIWVAIYVYGTMINRSSLIKKLMQTYIVKDSGSILNVSTVHLNGIWHLIWRHLSTPVLGGHYSIPRGCPLNTGFIVSYILPNYVIPHAMPHAIPQTHSAFYPHRHETSESEHRNRIVLKLLSKAV